MERREAVITGMGAVSPWGLGVEALWQGLLSGRSALRPITRFDASPFRNALGGEVPDFPPEPCSSRATAYLTEAASQAARQARLADSDSPVGAVMGTNFGGPDAALAAFGGDDADLTHASMGEAIGAVRAAAEVTGPVRVLSLACASGAAALGLALSWVRTGRADLVLAGGYDELSLYAYAGLSSLRAITTDRILPFHARRSGTLFAEGAGVLMVEAADHARARGVTALARLVGRGMNNDAFHMTAPDRTGQGMATVMSMALRDARLGPDAVAHVNCHATATKYNDLIETRAIKQVFGAHDADLVLTAPKSCIGHTMGAAGALESIATVLSIREGVVPPTLGLDEPDPEFDLDYCPLRARPVDVPVAMNNSFGLGGTNASLVFARA